MVSKQALQVQEDHEAWPQWTWRRAASHHLLIFSMLSGSLSALGGLYGQQSATHASQQLSEQLRALVSPAPPGSSAQTSDVIEIRNRARETPFRVVSTPNLWRVSPLRCSYVFYCLLCLKRQFYSRWLPITLSFSTFTDLLQCAGNKGFMKGQKRCYVMNDLLRCIY